MIFTNFQISILLLMAWQDFHHLRISNISILLLGFITLFHIVFKMCFWDQLTIFLLFSAGIYCLKYWMTRHTKSLSVGDGDIWVLSLLASSIPLEKIPSFIMWTGILGIIWGILYLRFLKSSSESLHFPFIPPILITFIAINFLS